LKKKTETIKGHVLVPAHKKLTEEEAQKILSKYNISGKQLPAILESDPAIQELNVKLGDIIEIIRKSPIAGEQKFYRVVVHG